jgi:hypothetical protein
MLAACYMLVSGLAVSSAPEDGGDMFLRNIGWLLLDTMKLYPRR